ncbi:hypothetical protein AgCh_022359 [Apium graveolens]
MDEEFGEDILWSVAAYEAALVPEAKQDELQNALWRNVFAEEGLSIEDASHEVQIISFPPVDVPMLAKSYVKVCPPGNFLHVFNRKRSYSIWQFLVHSTRECSSFVQVAWRN